MTLQSTTHLRGSIKTFTYSHRSSKLGDITIEVNAINESNSIRKAWADVSKRYANR